MITILCTVLILIGLFLLVASSMIESQLNSVSVKDTVERANKGIFTLAIVMLTVGVTLLAFGDKSKLDLDPVVLLSLLGVLGVILIVLAAIVVNKTSGTAKSWAIGVLVSGILFLLYSAGHITLQHTEFGRSLHFADDDSLSMASSDLSDFSLPPAKQRYTFGCR